YWNQFSAQLPDQSGGDVYYDCNQNSSYDAGVDGESFVQDIDMVFVITAKTTVGMEERSMNSVVSIYPNPSDGQFTLDFSKLAGGDVAFAVRDVLGELVYAEKEDISGFNKKQMDLSFLKTGVYFLTISNTDMQGTFKITIK
ncbi:MAG: T9SS type A sorting domain-containing protein, partial [Flavobacteriales bacterium]